MKGTARLDDQELKMELSDQHCKMNSGNHLEVPSCHITVGNNNVPPGMNHLTVGHERLYRRRSSYAFRAVKAVEHVARRMSVPSFSMNKIEEDLDKEISEEKQEEDANRTAAILQRSCREILHSKKVLLLVVLLNVLDCALVLGGLILDIHFIKEMVRDAKLVTRRFINLLKNFYPVSFGMYSIYDLDKVYNKLVTFPELCTDSLMENHTFQNESYFTASELPTFLTRYKVDHDTQVILGHAFHKASVAILGILLIFVMLKVFCFGKAIFKRKLELFDGIIVIASFTLDIIFIKGLTNYPLEETVHILAFLIPWRVVRVANSLVMAVMDQAHLQLKMVYKEKKAAEQKLQYSEDKVLHRKNIIKALEKLCASEGIPQSKVSSCINSCASPSKKKAKQLVKLKKKLPQVMCLDIAGERPSLPYGHIPGMSEETLSHLKRIASTNNHMSTFEDIPDIPESENEDDALLYDIPNESSE